MNEEYFHLRIPRRLPRIRNWKTTLSGITGAVVWACSHQTLWLPIVPPRYVPTANLLVAICATVFAASAKDAGNHSPATSVVIDPTVPTQGP